MVSSSGRVTAIKYQYFGSYGLWTVRMHNIDTSPTVPDLALPSLSFPLVAAFEVQQAFQGPHQLREPLQPAQWAPSVL